MEELNVLHNNVVAKNDLDNLVKLNLKLPIELFECNKSGDVYNDTKYILDLDYKFKDVHGNIVVLENEYYRIVGLLN